MKKNILFTLVFSLFCSLSISMGQIEVHDATLAPFSPPENLIRNYFLGEGVKVVDVKYEGAAAAVGYFNNAQNSIGINRGIVMTTGNAATTGSGSDTRYGVDADGSTIANNDNKNNPIDADINTIIYRPSPNTVYSKNLAKYTIKFIPSADTLRFRYVFASEEYPEYVCGSYNDVFGFFISGPGINGPYENNGVNLALIPDTNLPVTINNINLGKTNLINCKPKFTQFYIDNDKSNKQPVYDGFLKVFTAQAIVQPCKEYSIKLIVADVGDPSFDSGVFLEAKSFGTGSIRVDRVSAASDNNIIEGCSAGAINFRLPKKAEKDTPLKCNIIGSAINGVDYKLIATNFFVPKGDSVLKVNISAIQDGLFEGTETLGFDIQRDICNRDTFWFNIKDNNLKAVQRKTINDTTICQGQAINFDATIALVPPPQPTFENKDSVVINTVTTLTGKKPTILPIMVSNVTPLQFSPDMIESVCVNLRHTWMDDIDLYLIAPNGQFIALSTDNGGSGDDMTNACFLPNIKDDISLAVAPFTGNWSPEENFSELLNGTNNPSNGEWKLMVIDDTDAGKEGTVLDWKIVFKSNYRIGYQWNTNVNISCYDCPKPTVTPKSNFNYEVKIQDVYGCELRDTAKVTIKDSIAAPKLLCGITTHNSITFAWNNLADAKSYEISLNNGTWLNNALDLGFKVGSLTPNTPVTLSVRGVGTNCGAKISTLVCTTLPCTTVTPKIDLLSPITCKGKNDGRVQLSVVSGGTPPYTFTLAAQNNTTGLFANLNQGKYQVSIEDSNGCPALANFIVNEPEALKATLTADSVSCPLAADAEAIIEASGGTNPYSCLWSSGAKTDLIKGLYEGKYFVTLTDAAGCKLIDSIQVFEPKPMIIKFLQDPVSCSNKNDGTLTAYVESGGTAPFSYLWDTGTSLQPLAKIIGLKQGGYQITVTDDRGCKMTAAEVLGSSSPMKIAITTYPPSCNGAKTGKIETVINGGTTPYQYLWNSKDTTATIANIKGGKYILTVTDKNKCDLIQNIDLLEPDAIVLKKTLTPLFCFGDANAAIAIQVTGGNGGFNYDWSNLEKNKNINNLKSGIYILTVSDAKKCALKDTTLINEPDSLDIQVNLTDSDCSTNSSGAIKTTIKGGTIPYIYTWSGPNNFVSSDQNLSNLVSGIYTLTLTDGKNCSKVKSYEIKQPTIFSVNAIVTPLKCNADASGSILLLLKGGNEPYQFNWSNGAIVDYIKDLKSATYDVTMTDASGCRKIASYEVKQPDSLKLTLAKIDSLCKGATGELEIKAKGGVEPYTYQWSTGATNKKETNLAKGNYQVTVTDKNDCVAVISSDIFIYSELEINLLEVAPSCADGLNGKVEVTQITSDNVTQNLNNFTYKWNNNTSAKSIKNAKGGLNYNVTVTSAKGCTAEAMIQVSNPEILTVNLTKSLNPTCAKGNDGALECSAEGGTAPYFFVWSNGATTPIISGLSQGIYVITLTDTNGCEMSKSFNIIQPNSFSIKLLSKPEKCAGTATGIGEVQTKDGASPFKYLWSNGETTALAQKLLAGNNSVTVSDANGCIQEGTVIVAKTEPLSATLTTSSVRCNGATDGSFSIFPKGGTVPYLFSVNGNPFNGQYKRVGLSANVYEIVVKDYNNCTVDLVATIEEPLPIEIDLGEDKSLNFGESYRIPTQIKNVLNNNPKLSWYPDENKYIDCSSCRNPVVSPRISTLYTLLVQDSLGCKATKSINISIKVSNNIAVPTGFSPNSDGENDLLLVHGDEGATVLQFRIYDRWGNLLYENGDFKVNDKNIGWNGFFREESVPSGNYIWTLSVRFKNDSVENFKGSTLLIR